MVENEKAHYQTKNDKRALLYNPTPNYWIRVYYTDFYKFSSL